jgi:hypothetical protein
MLNPFQALNLLDRAHDAWDVETSATPEIWTPENPSAGQCAVTALWVHDELGGVLVRGTIAGGSHYWNRFSDGSELDLTRQQFEVWLLDQEPFERDRSYVLSFPDTQRRYEALLRNLAAAR